MQAQLLRVSAGDRRGDEQEAVAECVVELSAEEKDLRERMREESRQDDTVWAENLTDADWGFRDRRSNQ